MASKRRLLLVNCRLLQSDFRDYCAVPTRSESKHKTQRCLVNIRPLKQHDSFEMELDTVSIPIRDYLRDARLGLLGTFGTLAHAPRKTFSSWRGNYLLLQASEMPLFFS